MSTGSDAQRSIYALDNVRLELPFATAGSRTLAATLDYLLFFCLILVLSVAALFGVIVLGLDDLPEGGWFYAGILLGLFLVDLVYFLGQELLFRGQTLGKRALGLRVVGARGGRPPLAGLVVRNAVRLLDLLVGGWFLVLDPRARRIGDRLGGTAVVHDLPDHVLSDAVKRAPAGWGPDRIAVAEALLRRSETADPTTVSSLAQRLLDHASASDPSFTTERSESSTVTFMRAFGQPAAEPAAPPPPPSPNST